MKRNFLALAIFFVIILGLLPGTALADSAPFTLDTPIDLKAELKEDHNGLPYFELKLAVPQSIKDLDAKIADNSEYFEGKQCDPIEIAFDYKYGNYDWNEGPSHFWKTTDYLSEFLDRGYFEYRPFDSSVKYEDVDIKSETYYFKARFHSMWGYSGDYIDKHIYSDYSNTVKIGNPAYWSNVSTWAAPELQKAADAGIIPEILKGADMTKAITREEFCELSVQLYEKTTGKTAEASAANPFTDTVNPQILKAYKLGITSGTSATTFSPKVLINREQCATMLFRAIKVIKPDGDYSTAGVKEFPDQKYISSWAVEATKYMSKIGIISGNKEGEFMPKAATTAQETAGYGMATREQAIAMSMRTYEKIGR